MLDQRGYDLEIMHIGIKKIVSSNSFLKIV